MRKVCHFSKFCVCSIVQNKLYIKTLKPLVLSVLLHGLDAFHKTNSNPDPLLRSNSQLWKEFIGNLEINLSLETKYCLCWDILILLLLIPLFLRPYQWS